MTTTESPNPYVEPAAIALHPRGSAAAAGVAAYLGGYILVQSLTSPLASQLAGYGAQPDVITLFIGQLVFALLVVIVGFVLAPAPAVRKLVASAIVVVGVVVTLVSQVGRLSTGVGGIPLSATLANQFFMVTLLVGAGWLIVRFARIGWLALLLTVILIPLPLLFAFAGVTSVFSQMVLLVVMGVVGLVILFAGRPARQVVVTTAA